LLRGIVRACEKTGILQRRLEALVDEIEADLQQGFGREVTSNEIGKLVLRYLKDESEVAYVRFASVYRQFQGIRDFVDTLDHLQSDTELIDTSPASPTIASDAEKLETSASVMTPS
jgi:transcriptional repressor NrdR